MVSSKIAIKRPPSAV